MNLVAARLARAACDKFSTPEKPRFVAGALGPSPRRRPSAPTSTTRAPAMSTSRPLRAAYYDQARGLLDGGADLFLVETIFDTLERQGRHLCARRADGSHGRAPARDHFRHGDRRLGPHPLGPDGDGLLALSAPCAPAGRGPELRAGGHADAPYIEELAKVAGEVAVSCYPNAGLPNPMSETGFDETPDVTGRLLGEFAASGFLNIAGGCCGTTPEHIAAIAQSVSSYKPAGQRRRNSSATCSTRPEAARRTGRASALLDELHLRAGELNEVAAAQRDGLTGQRNAVDAGALHCPRRGRTQSPWGAW